jgi:tetratricopeptide (TPR) repeat protein
MKVMTSKKFNARNAGYILAAIFAVVFAIGAQNVHAQQKELKFDHTLQSDFSAGMGGDQTAQKRAFERADKILAANPNASETLVWQGSATLSHSGSLFQSGDFRDGAVLWQKGLQEMDKAVELAPESFAVRIVRGSTALNAAKHFPDPAVSKQLREKGAADYEKLLNLQDETAKKAVQSQLRRILEGLADAYDKLGDKAKAETYRQRLAAAPRASVEKVQ